MSIKLSNTNKSNPFVKILVYGESGSGKTVLCSTAPNPVIISAEKGLLSLADKDIPVVEVNTAEDCFEALKFFLYSNETKNFETICLDSISDIAEIILSDYVKEYKDARMAYGKLTFDLGHLIREFRDIPNKHVYMTAKQLSVLDERTNIRRCMPSMPSKAAAINIPYFFDEVLPIRINDTDPNNQWRYLQTSISNQYIAKDRSGKLKSIEKPDLTHIFNVIIGKPI